MSELESSQSPLQLEFAIYLNQPEQLQIDLLSFFCQETPLLETIVELSQVSSEASTEIWIGSRIKDMAYKKILLNDDEIVILELRKHVVDLVKPFASFAALSVVFILIYTATNSGRYYSFGFFSA